MTHTVEESLEAIVNGLQAVIELLSETNSALRDINANIYEWKAKS